MEPDKFRRERFIVAIAVILVLVGSFLVTYLACHNSSNLIGCVRDVAIIVLVLETMLVTLLLLVIAVVLTELVRLIQDGLLPVLKSSERTMKTVEGTTTFVSDTIAAPIIRLASFGSSVGGTFAALFLRRRRQGRQQTENQRDLKKEE